MTRIIAVVNQKGGVAKTTSCINIGAGLARLGKKVLLIDLDPQANLTYSLGIQGHESNTTIVELLDDKCTIQETLIKVSNYYVIPSKLDLANLERKINSKATGRELVLKKKLQDIINIFDYILIDCPPSASILVYNALAFANEVFIPVQCEYLSLHGLVKITSMIEEVKEDLNNNIKISGIIATMFQGISGLNKEVLQTLQDNYSSLLFKTPIRRTVSLADAQAENRDIFLSNINSNGSLDYWALCKEIVEQERKMTNE